nr:hypothetical protein [Tanacetum cinerariifolium]
FLNFPSQVSSFQEKLKILDSLLSILHKVTDTLNRFATMMENALGSTSMNVALPAEGEKNTKDADTKFKYELVDLLGKNVVTQYYTKKLLFDKCCDKILKRKKSPKIMKCEVLTKKCPIILKIYREDGFDEVISDLKVSDLHLGEWREVIQACPDKSEKGWKTIYDLTDESLPASPNYDRYHSGNGYHVVPPPYTGTFMPSKPDLVFHDVPNVNETVHTTFNVELSPTKPDKKLSHRPSAPIIKDWVSDSEDDSEAELLHNALSFVQPTEQVKTPRPSVKPIENSILATNHKTTIPKPKSQGSSRNKNACFVCKSLTYLIKDCDYYEKKMAQSPVRNHAHRGNHQQYSRMTLPNAQRHVVPTVVLTKSKLVPLTAARQVTTDVSPNNVTRPRPAKTVVTKPYLPPRRNINHRPSPKASTFPPKVTTAKAPMVNDVKGVQGNWGNPQYALKDKEVIDSGCLRHMIGNMSYLSDFEEINGGYVAFGGNQKGGKISRKGSDDSLSHSPIYDRYQSGNGCHVVPPPYTGTFMPPKPDLVFNNAPNAVETDHSAFTI